MPDSPPAAPPPSTLEEAWTALDRLFADAARGFAAVTEPQGMIIYHASLGRWMRNEWIRHGGGTLAAELRSRGLRHPDAMSEALLEAYWCRRHGVAFDGAAAAAAAAAEERAMAAPSIATTPDGQPIRWLVAQHLPTGALHGGRSPDGRAWVFDPAQGRQVEPAGDAMRAAVLQVQPP